MGVNFTAIYLQSFKLDELLNIPKLLQNDKSLCLLLGEIENKSWRWTEDGDRIYYEFNQFGSVSIEGPFSLSISVGKYLCELTHSSRWREFEENKDARIWLRKVCFHLSKYLGNPIYIPEIYDCFNFVSDGNTAEEVRTYLRDKFGEAINVQYIKQSSNYEYFYEEDFLELNYEE